MIVQKFCCCCGEGAAAEEHAAEHAADPRAPAPGDGLREGEGAAVEPGAPGGHEADSCLTHTCLISELPVLC